MMTTTEQAVSEAAERSRQQSKLPQVNAFHAIEDMNTLAVAMIRECDETLITEEFVKTVSVGTKHNPNWTAYYLFESPDSRMGDTWLRHWSSEFITNGREWMIENEQGDTLPVKTIGQFWSAMRLFQVNVKPSGE